MTITAARIKRIARKAELEHGSGGTGYTILKFRSSPIARLVEHHDIGPEEFWAATDIDLAFNAISGALTYKCPYSEKIDRGYVEHQTARVIDSVGRYKAFAGHWSKLRVWGDKTLEIVIAAVVDQRPLHLIEIELSLRHGKAKQVTIGGLRDYAARAHMVPPVLARDWMNAAAKMFHVTHPALRLAMLQAKHVVDNAGE
jgi:hypothetical protein